MKKVFFVLVLIMAVVVVNGQETKTTAVKEKPVRTAIIVSDLQQAITDNIAKDFVGYTVKEATKVVKGDMVKYEVVVVKGTTTETLVYDKDGKFVKKLPPEAEKKDPMK